METLRTETTEEQSLEILGISREEERVYRWLLSHPGATLAESSQALSFTPKRTKRLLESVESKGLATHSPERRRRYIPVSPEIAVEALISRRREDLDNAHSMVAKLQQQIPHEPVDYEQVVELINSREAERQVFEQMHITAQHEVLVLIRPPLRVSRLDAEQDYITQREAQARGVRYRSIIDADGLSVPGSAPRVMENMKSGEIVRSFPQLPFKMALVDRRLAIVPLTMSNIESPALLVHSSALLDALYALFEMLWEKSAPIAFDRSGVVEIKHRESQLALDSEKLLMLLAAGMNDKRVISELGVSSSTFSRRIAELMQFFNARTRFQLGWLSGTRSSEKEK